MAAANRGQHEPGQEAFSPRLVAGPLWGFWSVLIPPSPLPILSPAVYDTELDF